MSTQAGISLVISASLNPPAVLLTSKRHFFGDFLCASKESYPPQAEAFWSWEQEQSHWIPAFAGMTSKSGSKGRWIPRLRGDDDRECLLSALRWRRRQHRHHAPA